jgi:MFS transporter, DHA2 family, multidrug resistance protein
MVGAAPPERAGAAAGVSETSSELGGALGIAVLGAAGAAVYRAELDGAVPADVPAEAAGAAEETLGGAVAAADELPDVMGAQLVETAREAFTEAFQLATTLNAAVAFGAAILAAALLRRVRMPSELGEGPGGEHAPVLPARRPC